MNKIIHYCWFGDKPIDDLGKRCIESWKKYCPDYEIKLWNEQNFDLSCCDYVREAAEEQKWAFVSDFVRIYVVYQYGGIYFDTDVELIRPIDDLVCRGPFLGFETDPDGSNPGTVALGLGFGGNPGMLFLRELLDGYRSSHFIISPEAQQAYTIVHRVDDALSKYGIACTEGIQEVAGFTIYPADFFNPKNAETGIVKIGQNTRSIHHFSASWYSATEKRVVELKYAICSHFPGLPPKIASLIAKILCGVIDGDWHPLANLIKRRLKK